MGVRTTTYEGVTSKVALYDSTSDTAFGPVFDTEEEAGDFLYWLDGVGVPDARAITPAALDELAFKYFLVRGDETVTA
jgi:hypothetical protein